MAVSSKPPKLPYVRRSTRAGRPPDRLGLVGLNRIGDDDVDTISKPTVAPKSVKPKKAKNTTADSKLNKSKVVRSYSEHAQSRMLILKIGPSISDHVFGCLSSDKPCKMPSTPCPVPLVQHVDKKRKAAHTIEPEEAVAPTIAPKRQRTKLKASNSPENKTNILAKVMPKVEATPDLRPEPRGYPEVWAENRQHLCESLMYYQSRHGAAYAWNGYVYGFLLDNDNDVRGYMSEKVMITRAAGGYKPDENGKMRQAGDQNSDKTIVKSFKNNQRDFVPVVLIVGSDNVHCPTKVPHRYNVLGLAHVTDIWAERVQEVGKSITVVRIRFEMLDLATPSWWGAGTAPCPLQEPDLSKKAECSACMTCRTESKEIYDAGWMCLNDRCPDFWKMKGKPHTKETHLNEDFTAERNPWPCNIRPPFAVKPAPPSGQLQNPSLETSMTMWKGMVCPRCGKCNSRTNWDVWECSNQGCDFFVPINHTIFSTSDLSPNHSFEAEGHAIPFDTWDETNIRRTSGFLGHWRVLTYYFPNGDYVVHKVANMAVNQLPGGADEILAALQAEKMGLSRFPLASAAVEGEQLTRHFGMNYGMPYKYSVEMASKAFSEAPSAILDTLNMVAWAGQQAVGETFQPFNECLCLGYMEEQKINYHDDGEKDLGPDVTSVSLGGAAIMHFRMKAKDFFCKKLTRDNHDPTAFVLPGTQAWQQRTAVNALFASGPMKAYEKAKEELFQRLEKESGKKTTSPIISLRLRHGDMVTMHGNGIHQKYEHAVTPEGKLRYGITGRYVKPENLSESEHWKAERVQDTARTYDGGVGAFKALYPDDVVATAALVRPRDASEKVVDEPTPMDSTPRHEAASPLAPQYEASEKFVDEVTQIGLPPNDVVVAAAPACSSDAGSFTEATQTNSAPNDDAVTTTAPICSPIPGILNETTQMDVAPNDAAATTAPVCSLNTGILDEAMQMDVVPDAATTPTICNHDENENIINEIQQMDPEPTIEGLEDSIHREDPATNSDPDTLTTSDETVLNDETPQAYPEPIMEEEKIADVDMNTNVQRKDPALSNTSGPEPLTGLPGPPGLGE